MKKIIAVAVFIYLVTVGTLAHNPSDANCELLTKLVGTKVTQIIIK